MAGFDAAAEKRKAFIEKQKKYKKAWRKELSNLEFASGDADAKVAVEALYELIKANGYEVPEGIRKQDLDQVYKAVQPRLGKEARMEFLKLDQVVRDITSVKNDSVGQQIE
jgi:N-acetyl-anhydromuramyl-L-alanine amidase AmpD